MSKGPEALVDLHKLTEDQRIDHIGHVVTAHGKTVAICVDATPGKAERYVRKLKRKFPGVTLIDTTDGPTKGVVTIRVGPHQH